MILVWVIYSVHSTRYFPSKHAFPSGSIVQRYMHVVQTLSYRADMTRQSMRDSAAFPPFIKSTLAVIF